MILRVCLKFKSFLDAFCKRLLTIFFIILISNFTFIDNSFSKGGLIKSTINFFKSFGKEAPKVGDDILKNGKTTIDDLKKGGDELFKDIKNKQTGNTAAQADEGIVLERIGADNHIVEFKTLKKSSRSEYIRHLRQNADQALDYDLFDIYESVTSNAPETSNIQISFKSYVLLNWIGKIYIKSNYFNKPKFEDKTMLVCKNIDQVFYLSLFMEQEPKRAFLTKNLKFKKNKKNISPQELFIIEDTERRKIMVTWPVNTEFPQNYFVIYPNQNFYYENPSSGTVSPEQFKKYLSKRKSFKNKCFKATESGLL